MKSSPSSSSAPVTTQGRTHAYTRVSTDDQRDSLLTQLDMIGAEISRRRLPLLQEENIYIDEDVSGKTPFVDRPAGKRLLQSVQKGDTVLVTKVNRLGRRASKVLWAVDMIEELGAKLIVLDFFGMQYESGSPLAKLLMTMLAGIAEWQRHEMLQAVKETNEWRRKMNLPCGGQHPRWGFRMEQYVDAQGKSQRRLVPNPKEQRILHIAQLHRARGETYQTIADHLESLGMKKRNGARFYPQDIVRLCNGGKRYEKRFMM